MASGGGGEGAREAEQDEQDEQAGWRALFAAGPGERELGVLVAFAGGKARTGVMLQPFSLRNAPRLRNKTLLRNYP